ncbi:VanZ family protein [Gemmatimonas sp.]|uniref:VanZ family protein n=1 Tax=Gemmatimonas sp. TaxID=1962908 RepID=UPI003569C872
MASVALIAVATLAPYGAMAAGVMPPRWCLVCGGLWATDGISNVVLFGPFGLALSMLGVRWWLVLVLSAGFSLGVEYLQSIGVPPGRSAAWADVVANALGGLLGAWLWARRGWVFPTSWRVAAGLSWGWAVGVVLLFGLTSAALGPRSGEGGRVWADVAGLPTYGSSTLLFTPGYGWFGGLADTLTVNGVSFTHRGTGPLMAVVSREPARVAMRVVVRGREDGGALVPIGYLHVVGDSSAVAFVGEEGETASLIVTRRAWDWGLAMPTLQLDSVFAGRSVIDPSVVVVEAWIAPDTLRLSARSAAFSGTRSMALTPLLGWALIQTVFSIGGDFELLAHICWIAVLMVPIGWWGIQALTRRWRVLAIALLWLAVSAAAMPRVFGVAPVGGRDWVLMIGLLAVGAAAGRAASSAIAPLE